MLHINKKVFKLNMSGHSYDSCPVLQDLPLDTLFASTYLLLVVALLLQRLAHNFDHNAFMQPMIESSPAAAAAAAASVPAAAACCARCCCCSPLLFLQVFLHQLLYFAQLLVLLLLLLTAICSSHRSNHRNVATAAVAVN
jgi:hypothetical protein